MNDINFWKRTFLCGASLFLIAASPALASGVDAMSTEGVAAVQQNGRTVTVTVNDAMGPVIGANVLVAGTTIGSITDIDGNAVIQGVPNNAVIVISYIGYITQEVQLQNGQTSVTVTLREDSETLEEVVVVGYGTQAKKDITGSVAVVSRDAIAEQPVATFAEALQGRASGVYVTSSGAPGAGTTIRVRGVGSVNGSSPLIIVDGVQGVDVNSVNPNDIDSFQVLKDAAATAIYGAQAANGVIIITTKQGNKEGKVRVSYSGYVSASTMANDGFHMLGAWDYMKAVQKSQENQVNVVGVAPTKHQQFGVITDGELQMPYMINPNGMSKADAMARWGSYEGIVADYDRTNRGKAYALSAYYYKKEILGQSEEEARKGTDWYDMIVRTGISHNHELSVQGGGEKGQYSMSLAYQNRQGTVKNSDFERYSLRVNTTFNPTKHLTIGVNTNSSVMMTKGERGGMADGGAFGSTYTMNAWVPAYNVGGDFAGSVGDGGRNYSALSYVLRAENNWNRMFRNQSAFFVQINDPWIKGLTLRSQFAVNLNGGWGIAMTQDRTADDKEYSAGTNSFNENASWSFGWQWTNTATYKFNIADKHDITVLFGTETLKQGLGRNISATRNTYQFENDPNTWTLSNGGAGNQTNSGGMGSKTTMFGFFGRADYSYQCKYLSTFTIRRDAASKFSENNRWGTFPSISVGWRISDEKFMEKAHATWLDDLKLRAGYGTTGNSNIGAYNYAFQYASGNNYLYGIEGANSGANVGFGVTNLGDKNAKWETVKMFNVGYDLTAFNNKLTSSFDFYIKKTSDMLVSANWTNLSGAGTKPNINIGDMKNVGIDFSIGWRDKIGQLSYNINANASWYKNKVTKLGGADLFEGTGRISNVQIITENQPISMFYGYQLDGIYKSRDEVLNYNTLPYGVNNKVELTGQGTPDDDNYIPESATSWVGHYKFKDLNGDGKINGNDRTFIGNPHPDLTGGVNLGLNWKNWDLGTYLYYSIGNDVFKVYEFYTLWGSLSNCFSYERIEKAWHPTENPNGKLPLWVIGNTKPEISESHSGYIADGSYLRMQTLTLGYTLPKKWINKLNLSRIRLYAQMSNVFTITGYEGLDPEMNSSSDRNKGQDFGAYGMPRQYLFGINIDF